MPALDLANTTLSTLPVVDISIPELTHTTTTFNLTNPPTLIPHFTVAPPIPYPPPSHPDEIFDRPRHFPPRELNAADTAITIASPVTSRYQRTEYMGYPVTWITRTRTIFDVDQDGVPDYLTRHVAARDIAGGAEVNTMIDDNAGTTTTDNAQDSDTPTPTSNLFEALATASHLADLNPFTYPSAYPYPYPYSEIPHMPGPVIPSTFATLTRPTQTQTPNPLQPRDQNIPSKSFTEKLDITLTAVAWTTFWIPGPDSTRTQEGTVTLETGLVVPTTEVNGQPVVTLETEGRGVATGWRGW